MSATYMNGGLFDDKGNPVSLATNGLPIISGVVEDAASANADPGFPVLVVRRDTAAVGSGTDGDYSLASCDANGKVWTSAELTPVTAGGLSAYKNLSVGVTGDVVKASAGQVYAIDIFNLGTTSASAFVKIYDKATTPTQADTPVLTIGVPTLQTKVISVPHGITFASGISVRATTAPATNSTAAPTANDVVVNVLYK